MEVSDVLGLFGTPAGQNPGPESLKSSPGNIKSGLSGAAQPPYGLILSENVAMGPRMLLEAPNAQKLF